MRKVSYSIPLEARAQTVTDYLNKCQLINRGCIKEGFFCWLYKKKREGQWVSKVIQTSEKSSQLIDEIEISSWSYFFKRKKIESFFTYMHQVILADLTQLQILTPTQKKILLAGSSGFVGKTLCRIMTVFGYQVTRLVRKEPQRKDEIFWDPEKELIFLEGLEGFDAFINLCGVSIFALRWTPSKKEKIQESRIRSTAFLVKILSKLKNPPKLFICASAIGYYGDSKDQELTEESKKGAGFLSDVANIWEKEALECTSSKVITARFGLVLGSSGGLLQKIKLPFKMGLGAIFGSGKEWISWIAVDDLAYTVIALCESCPFKGPINMVSPHPVTSRDFALAVCKTLNRNLRFKAPPFLLKLLLGELSTLMLYSQKVYPKKLLESGALFSYPNLEKTLKHYLTL